MPEVPQAKLLKGFLKYDKAQKNTKTNEHTSCNLKWKQTGWF